MRFGLLGLLSEPTTFVITALIMVMALIFHNIVQTFVADRLGDRSPRLAGFMAFDPKRQLDLYGLFFLVLLGFGWPKSIPVNPRNYRGRGRSEGWVWVSGIGAYLLVSFLSLLVAALFGRMGEIALLVSFRTAASIALLHAVINLFPILPLDMGRAALAWGSAEVRRVIMRIAQFGILGFIVFFFILNATGILNQLMLFFQRLFVSIIGLIPGL